MEGKRKQPLGIELVKRGIVTEEHLIIKKQSQKRK